MLAETILCHRLQTVSCIKLSQPITTTTTTIQTWAAIHYYMHTTQKCLPYASSATFLYMQFNDCLLELSYVCSAHGDRILFVECLL